MASQPYATIDEASKTRATLARLSTSELPKRLYELEKIETLTTLQTRATSKIQSGTASPERHCRPEKHWKSEALQAQSDIAYQCDEEMCRCAGHRCAGSAFWQHAHPKASGGHCLWTSPILLQVTGRANSTPIERTQCDNAYDFHPFATSSQGYGLCSMISSMMESADPRVTRRAQTLLTTEAYRADNGRSTGTRLLMHSRTTMERLKVTVSHQSNDMWSISPLPLPPASLISGSMAVR